MQLEKHNYGCENKGAQSVQFIKGIFDRDAV